MSENMKLSGIDWMGDIPESWSLSKIRFVTKLRTEQGLYSENDKYIGLENISSYTGKYIETETEYEMGMYDVCMKNDVLFSKLRPYLAKAMIAKDSCFCTGELAVIKNYSGDKRFLFYYLLSDGFLKMVDASTYGSKMPRASWEYIKNLQIPVLTNFEQTLIADFLDEQCEKVDSIVSDLEKQIEILRKYKKSLITETVTKGLDKSVPMKDSGIEWIGDIPEHYSLVPLKNLFWMYAGGDVDEYDFSDERTDKYKYAIYSNSLENNGLFGYTSQYRFKGDTITVTGRGDVGKALPRYDAYYPIVRLLVCVPQKKLSVSFFSYCINCADILGDQTAMVQLTTQKLGVVKVPVPTYEEQTHIAKYLDKQCAKVDSIIESKKEQLTKITQHKKSLIYEYVTGKKRVKGENNNGN